MNMRKVLRDRGLIETTIPKEKEAKKSYPKTITKKGKATVLSKEPKKKTKGPRLPRVETGARTRSIGGAPVFAAATDALVKMYEMNLNVLNQALHCGAVNLQLGTLSLMIYADILHGGAYACPVNLRPFTAPNPQASPYYAGELKNVHPTEGLLGWLISVLGLTHATDIPTEIMVNSNVPHVFPKLLSDEAYQAFMYLFAYTATTAVFKDVGSGVSTYVEAATKLMESSAKVQRENVETAKAAIPKEEDLKGLMSLLSLLGAV